MTDRGPGTDGEEVTDDVSTREDWESVPVDPDPLHDLGYETMELEVFETEDGSGRMLVLPTDEDMLADDAFIVAQPSDVVDLGGKT